MTKKMKKNNMKNVYISILLCFTILTAFLSPTSSAYAGAPTTAAYLARFNSITTLADVAAGGYITLDTTHIIDSFSLNNGSSGEINEFTVYAAVHSELGRAALFFANTDGNIIYKSEDLECNYFQKGLLYQPNIAIDAIGTRDVNHDGLMDILLITRCLYDGVKFKIGDILFQNANSDGFYMDWRVSDKINRFSMNKDIDMMAAFASGGQSSEFLYSAATMDELMEGDFKPLKYQTFDADFEKFGTVQVVPGTYKMGSHYIFILYLVDGEGRVLWNFQAMRDYDNFSQMLGISFKDVDGDGWADLSVFADYINLDDNNDSYAVTDFSIYYQRDGYFFEDTDFHNAFVSKLTGSETMDDVVQAARKYWGW
jgi:hypothetical protein